MFTLSKDGGLKSLLLVRSDPTLWGIPTMRQFGTRPVELSCLRRAESRRDISRQKSTPLQTYSVLFVKVVCFC